MAVSKDKDLSEKLKKRLHALQRKHNQAHKKLKLALQKMKKMERDYKHKLASKARLMKDKLIEVQASTYAKVVRDVERQLLKDIEAKCKSLRMAVDKLEKQQPAKKGEKAGKAKKTTRVKRKS